MRLKSRKKTKRTTNYVVLWICLSVSFLACQKESSIEGLWLVENVQMGEDTMTPVSRWMRFQSDNTQTSGNGWLQHSYGTWSIQKDQLIVEDTNGIVDNVNPFTVDIQSNRMIWKRIEDGLEVVVNLKRIEELPQSEGNKLIGLWKLTKSTVDENDVTVVVNPEGTSMLHLRWDHVYVEHNMPKGKNYGVYKVHGHKPEIQLVNYGDESQFSFWNFSVHEEKLTLTSTDGTSTMEFERITQYLQ